MVNGDSVIYDDKEKKAMEIISDLEREMLKRMDEAAPLEGKAEEIHQLVLGRIQDYFPNLKRQCFEKRDMKEIGCLLRDKNGVYHPLINRMVARLSGSSQFDFFQMDNNQNGISVTPEDFLANIIAHEYGHIVKNEFLRSVGLLDYSSVTDINSLKELLTYDEAFAFWFADSISRTRRNIHFVAQSYKHLNPDSLERIYDDLTSLSTEHGVRHVLEPANLSSVFEKNKGICFPPKNDYLLKINEIRENSIPNMYCIIKNPYF